MNNKVQGKVLVLPFILVTSLFFMWGLANNMTDTLLAAFKKIMSMSDFQTSFIQFAFYGAYFCLALPAAYLIFKKSYKFTIILGLIFYITGCFLFYPASITAQYFHFLIALYVLAGGCSILETAANPYIIAMGPEETGTRRLNLAQAFNPIGSLTGVILSKNFILSKLNTANATERGAMSAEQLKNVQTGELNAITYTYVAVGLILLFILIIILVIKMPTLKSDYNNFSASLRRLVKNKAYMLGVLTQFFYVGAQIGVWSFIIRYVMNELNLNEEQASNFYIASSVSFISARWIYTFLMKYIKPAKLLTFSAFMAVISLIFVVFAQNRFAVYSLVSVSAFMSLMFPTIFGISVRGIGQDTKVAGSGHIMAIIGGAIIPLFMGLVSENFSSIKLAYLVPLCCFVFITIYSAMQIKRT